jgi:hypothetical protein
LPQRELLHVRVCRSIGPGPVLPHIALRINAHGIEMEKMHLLKSSRERVRVCIVSNKV